MRFMSVISSFFLSSMFFFLLFSFSYSPLFFFLFLILLLLLLFFLKFSTLNHQNTTTSMTAATTISIIIIKLTIKNHQVLFKECHYSLLLACTLRIYLLKWSLFVFKKTTKSYDIINADSRYLRSGQVLHL